MNKKSIVTIIAVCTAIGAAVAAIVLFHEEITDFVKKIINKIDYLRNRNCCDYYDDIDEFDEFDDFDDVVYRF